ncbi:hypothetical protein VIOR3934_20581 [Vibrio orientalis CIP 102891 = ATCC 33934]|uniref:Uncharacterized protein n=1 Tax=Vibrio orientalis CIP 102891 = ATCC 33934 TaxID=675816 RepID=F9SRJ4_VIBOR|nr:hypothetical protein VIOR3934_20581 [Vibrio orientalis CIP 102891 = ATCC 33934]
MGCCNQAPKGGSTNLGLLIKSIAALAVILFLLAAVFG